MLITLHPGLAMRAGTHRPVWAFLREPRQGDVPGFRLESPMIATKVTCPKGPALLAKAGVTLTDALWLYRQSRAGAVANDAGRMEPIRRKVQSFLASSAAPARGRMAYA